MRKFLILFLIILLLCMPVSALDLTAPPVPPEGAERMPENPQSFQEGVLEIMTDAIGAFRPDLKEAAVSGLRILAVVLLLSIVNTFPGIHSNTAQLTGAVMVGLILLGPADALIRLGADTVTRLSEYGKLLLPVMTAALAAQGGVTSAAAMYAGTAAFNAVLSGLTGSCLVPMVYLMACLSIGAAALADPMLKKLSEGISRIAVWCLKTILYVYTGYISITGIVSGTTDANVLKAAKLTISGVVPVVGGILSDASEAILVSAGTVKNAAGIYGMLAVMAVWIGPFLRIAAHYLILKGIGLLCEVSGVKAVTTLVGDFSSVMGLLLAMTGTVCLMLVISTICFMKGVGL